MILRKIKISHLIIPVFLFIFNVFMIFFPKEIFTGATVGLHLWFEKVIPSLLPFMISTNCLIAIDFPRFFGKYIQPFTIRIFNLGGEECFPLMVGLTAGFPMGIKTTAQLYAAGSLSKQSAHRLMMFCNNAGALFILGTVGTGFFGDAKAGYFLILCSCGASLFLAFLTGLFSPKAKPDKTYIRPKKFTQKILADSIRNSINSILAIGCYIIIFSVINEVFSALHIYDGTALMLRPLGLARKTCEAISMGIFEITNACSTAAGVSSDEALPAAAALIGWGGLSVHAQSLEFLNGTDLDSRFYFTGKLLTAILSLIFALLLRNIFF